MKGYSLRDARRLASGSRDWREAIWNKWLVGYLTPRSAELSQSPDLRRPRGWTGSADGAGSEEGSFQPEVSIAPCVEPAAAVPARAASSSADSTDDGGRTAGSSEAAASGAGSPATVQAGPTPPDRAPENRRVDDFAELSGARRAQAVRARLDHLLEQMDTLEVAVDRISERQSVSASHDRLQLRSVTDILARLVETQERHTESLIACTRAIDRLERRVMWAERNGRPLSALADDLTLDLRAARDVVGPDTIVPPSMTQRIRRPAESHRSSGDTSAPLGGKLSDISLPTLLSMAELEGWTGRLTLEVQTDTVLIDLDGGLLVSVFEDDSPSDAVEALYHLIETRDGRFTFTPMASVTKTELAPMTVGTLLLRASHRRDELSRLEVGA